MVDTAVVAAIAHRAGTTSCASPVDSGSLVTTVEETARSPHRHSVRRWITALSARPEQLCEAGTIDRESDDETPPRVEYRPTENDRALRPVLEAVADCIDEYEA